ncbi:hypothetical protein [Methylobacterium oryzisoli]|uniref:hypothetical protein n=1 Tax=Methylobacterium oryzisoli TaxID=3385502 RepID=UPI00397CFAC9
MEASGTAICVGAPNSRGTAAGRRSHPGLHAEAATLDELVEIITDPAPDLVRANCPQQDVVPAPSIPLRVEHVVNATSSAAC